MCDENIPPNLSAMKEDYKHDAETLVKSMIAHRGEERLIIKQVQAHHLFWDAEKKLTFIQTVSDYIIRPQSRYDEMQPIFEAEYESVAKDWRRKLRDASAIVGNEFDSMRTNRQGDGICDLLRNIRNLKNHYDEKKQEFKGAIGNMPHGVYQFFKKLFPKLFNYAYDIMKQFKEEQRFVNFYVYKKQDHLRIKAPDDGSTSTLVCCSDVAMDESKSSSTVENPNGTVDSSKVSAPKKYDDVLSVSSCTSSVQPTCAKRTKDKENGNLPESTPRTGLTTEIATMSLKRKEDGNRLILRQYQEELAQQALKGENSLIVAPTGSGKTAVLTKIIERHLYLKEGNGRVIFMAPKTALARQQFRYLQRYLDVSINYMIGEELDSVPVGQRILDNEITVLTPQILINELAKEEGESYVSFRDISMLIFDECHNATKNHPYRQLMDMLLDFEDSPSKSHIIQVIGVTASPGVGKAKDKTKVKSKLVELLGNLNVMSPPSTVEKNLEELARHHSKVKEFFLQIRTEMTFGHEVVTVVMELEGKILELLAETNASIRKAPMKKASQPYNNWIEDLNSVARNEVHDGEKSRLIISYTANLKLYHYLLQLKDLVPDAIEQAKKKVSLLTEGPEQEEMEGKREELKKKAISIQTPMFDRLLKLLEDELTSNQRAQILVFVEWKLTAECLTDCISKSLEGSKPVFLIGTQNSGGTRGLTKHGQDEIVEDFRSGKYNILVATSIAEAGLDFDDCSLVVMYNYVTGEVGREQRKGRGRTKNSRAIIMTTIGSDLKKREEENISRVAATKTAIDDIKKFDMNNLKNLIRNAQKKHRAERKRKASTAALKNAEPPARWQILCGACKSFLTTGDKLRHIDNMHTIVKDRQFFTHTEKRSMKKAKGPNITGLADYHCMRPNCREKVALGMEHENKLYPALSIKKIILKNEEGKFQNPKKRKNLPFQIDISVDECDEDNNDDDDIYETVDRTKAIDESTASSLTDNDCIEYLEIVE